MKTVAAINSALNDIVWGVPAMVLILGVGLIFTIATRGLQFRKFGFAMKSTLGTMFSKKGAGKGAVTPFEAVCTALSATVGTGNIAGVAGAIAIGGPGAMFWMWLSALLGMCTKYSEVTLALKYRERNPKGDWVGGPMYYIKNGLGKNWIWLAFAFALLGTLASFGIGCTTQVNTIVTAVNTSLSGYSLISEDGSMILNIVLGTVLGVIILATLLGGIKRIGNVTTKLVPFMAILYIVLGLAVVIININKVPSVFVSIFEGAFKPSAVTGGIVGSLFISMKKGIARGIFSNESGLGTASIAHASAENKEPCNQGMFGIFEVFADTIVICTLTALIILCSGTPVTFGEAAGAELTISGFTATFGNWSAFLISVALICFALSTIIGWGLYGSRCIEYLLGSKAIKPYIIVYSAMCLVGATLKLDLIWDISDTLNGLMAIPNLIALALLSPVVVSMTKEYFGRSKQN